MLYRIFCWINGVYPLAVFFLYIGLFLMTFAIAFLIPGAAILLLIFSILALVPFVFLNSVLKYFERLLAPNPSPETIATADVEGGVTDDASASG